MDKVSINDFNKAVVNWHKGDKVLRLGQHLMNTMDKLLSYHVVNPSVFYEENHNKAHDLFKETYVDNEI